MARARDADPGSLKEEKKSLFALLSKRILFFVEACLPQCLRPTYAKPTVLTFRGGVVHKALSEVRML
jgi:hypothetical protein